MSLHLELLSSDIAQLLFVSGLVIISVWSGQSLYRRGSRIESKVSKRVEHRKRPALRYVLYDMVWAPFILIGVFFIIRAGVELLPPGSTAETLTALLNTLLILSMLWLAIRIFNGVFSLAEEQEEQETISEA